MASGDKIQRTTKKRKLSASAGTDNDAVAEPSTSSSNPTTTANTTDSRFTFSAEDLASDNDEEEDGLALAGDDDDTNTDKPKGLPAHLLPTSSKNKKTPGLIYLSRIPPGMGPSKVKHLLSNYGEVGRVFLARADPDPPRGKNGQKAKEKHREHKFAEGWVEFLDKKVARSVADLLNANNIGGKKGTRWRDDVWTMKYLPRFRWDQLSEQVALERATQTSLLRFHLQHSRTEQESYLASVEQARVQDAMDTKAEGRGKEKKVKRERNYRQREAVDEAKKVVRPGTQKDLDGVLDRLF